MGRVYGHSDWAINFAKKNSYFTVCQQGSIKSLQNDDRLFNGLNFFLHKNSMLEASVRASPLEAGPELISHATGLKL